MLYVCVYVCMYVCSMAITYCYLCMDIIYNIIIAEFGSTGYIEVANPARGQLMSRENIIYPVPVRAS